MSQDGRILLVGTDPRCTNGICTRLVAQGFDVRPVESVDQAIQFLDRRARDADAVLTDVSGPSMQGLNLVKFARQKSIPVPVVTMTGDHRRDPFEIISKGTNTLYQKPVDFNVVASTIRTLTRDPHEWLGMRCEHYGFLSDTGIQAPFRKHLEERLKSNGFSDTQIAGIVLAVDELYTNGVLHGNYGLGSRKADPDAWTDKYKQIMDALDNPKAGDARKFLPLLNKKIYVDLRFAESRVMISIRDEGTGFDWQGHLDRIKNGVAIGISGFGISMARRIMDEVWYNDEGNEVTVVCTAKDLKPKAA